MGYRLERPDVDPEQSTFEYTRDGELCAVGGSRFILANIVLPYHEDRKFVWTCWVCRAMKALGASTSAGKRSEEGDEPAIGWPSSDLPTYEPRTWAMRRASSNPSGSPLGELGATNHPLALEQRDGISDERIAAIYHAFAGMNDR